MFCGRVFHNKLLNPEFRIPKPKALRQIIINNSNHLLLQKLHNIGCPYVSIMLDGTSRWKHHFISIILYTRFQYIYYKTKIVTSENALSISGMLNECILNLKANKKIVCSICCNKFSANKSACENLTIPIFRQYCNCHCASLALSNQFSDKKRNHKITVQIQLALRLLKQFNPPFLSNIKWKSLSDCLNFIVDNISNLNQIIDNKIQKDKSKKKDQYTIKKVKCYFLSYFFYSSNGK